MNVDENVVEECSGDVFPLWHLSFFGKFSSSELEIITLLMS